MVWLDLQLKGKSHEYEEFIHLKRCTGNVMLRNSKKGCKTWNEEEGRDFIRS